MDNNINFTQILVNFTALVSFVGSRQLITDVYNRKQHIFDNPLIKILIILSILYMNIKNLKITILFFFFYILFIEE